MKNILKSALILCLITLIAGFALSAVYQITKDPIAESEMKAKNEAYKTVMPDATTFNSLEGNDEIYESNADGVKVNECKVAKDKDNQIIGYVFNATSPNGYGGNIVVAVGILNDGTIQAISIISQSETAGLGANCEKPSFTDQFKGIQSNIVKWTKTGKSASNEIDAISGATLTTKAVVGAVNAALDCFYSISEGGEN